MNTTKEQLEMAFLGVSFMAEPDVDTFEEPSPPPILEKEVVTAAVWDTPLNICDENNNNETLPSSFICECGKKYSNKYSLARHKKIHTKEEMRCPICAKPFYSKYDINRHKETHNKTEYKCNTCSKTFLSDTGLKLHQSMHTGQFKHLCPTCGRGFNNLEGFHAHISSHDKSKRFQCLKCQSMFSCSSNLRRHSCGTVVGSQQFECDVCGKNFKQQRYLTEHLKGHSNPERFICGTCGQFYKFKSSLYKHCKNTGHK